LAQVLDIFEDKKSRYDIGAGRTTSLFFIVAFDTDKVSKKQEI